MVDSPAPGAPKDRGDWSRAVREAGPYLGIGTSFAASVLLGVGLGYWLDRKLGSTPWLLLLGSALGLFTGFYQFYRTVAGRKTQ